MKRRALNADRRCEGASRPSDQFLTPPAPGREKLLRGSLAARAVLSPGGGVQEARPPLGGLSERQALWMDVGPQLSRAVPGAEAASGCVPFLHGQ